MINERCRLKTPNGHCVVRVSGIMLTQDGGTDRWAEAEAIGSVVEQGWATPVEVARAFHCTGPTVRGQQRRFEESGLAGRGRERGYPRGRARLAGGRWRLVRRLKSQGWAQREIARRIGVRENAVRKLLRR